MDPAGARARRGGYGACPVRVATGHGERRVYDQGEVVVSPVCGQTPIGAISFTALPGSRGNSEAALDAGRAVKTLERRGMAHPA